MDEIHVKSTFTYKGGKIIGSSLDPTDPAKTVFAFMVSSLSKKWLNQKDYNKTFTYPNFDQIHVSNTAVFEEIRPLYKSDQHAVAKLAPRLTSKACWPSI